MRNIVIGVVVSTLLGACVLYFPRGRGEPASAAAATPAEPPEVRAERHFFRGEYKEAIEAYRRVVASRPDDGIAWVRLAYATHELGDFGRAVPLHERAAEFAPNRNGSLYLLGCALARLGRADEAIEALEGAVEAGYDDRSRAELEPDLASLRGDPRFGLVLDRMAPPQLGRGPLDFWAGDWIIWDADGREVLGYGSVRHEDKSHIFVEQWSENQGSPGRGMAFLDPSDGRWHLVRVDAEGEVHRLSGTFRDGALDLSGERVSPGGRVTPMRGVIARERDGWVRRRLQSSDDGGERWTTLSDVLLRPDEPPWIRRRHR